MRSYCPCANYGRAGSASPEKRSGSTAIVFKAAAVLSFARGEHGGSPFKPIAGRIPLLMPRRLISVVSPCLNEEDNVRNCYEQVRRVFAEQLPGYDYEHIFCDNSSSDRTAEILSELAESDRHVKVILNARNFG